jgi:glycine/D-amino acid oxidase-like deaminating enzyme
MWGLQLAPITGRLAAQLITGAPPEHDPAPLSPDRFRPAWHRVTTPIEKGAPA